MSNYEINRERWKGYPFLAQMANISAEVGRSINARRKGQEGRAMKAMERALDLFAATSEQLAENKSYRLKEVLRARNEYLRLFYDDAFEKNADEIERYFYQFAAAYGRADM